LSATVEAVYRAMQNDSSNAIRDLHGVVLLALRVLRLREPLLPLVVESVEPLEQFVEHGAGVRLHDALSSLEAGEVAMWKRRWIQRCRMPRNGSFDTRLSAPQRGTLISEEEEQGNYAALL
jgi:hypothetical protein